jgi:hypothetical protein
VGSKGCGSQTGAPQAIALQSNRQVVVGGSVNDASPTFGGLASIDSNGDLDTTFGSGGTLTMDNLVSSLLITDRWKDCCRRAVRQRGNRAGAVSGGIRITGSAILASALACRMARSDHRGL